MRPGLEVFPGGVSRPISTGACRKSGALFLTRQIRHRQVRILRLVPGVLSSLVNSRSRVDNTLVPTGTRTWSRPFFLSTDAAVRRSKDSTTMVKKKTFRIVSRGTNGELRTRDYDSAEEILNLHSQVGIDDCSTDLSLRGLPVFRGLIGPMTGETGCVRYESPEVFEALTKEWSAEGAHKKRRRRRTKAKAPAESTDAVAATDAIESAPVEPAPVEAVMTESVDEAQTV